MRGTEDAQALALIEKAVLAIQARHHPGRPMFYVMDCLRSDVRKAKSEGSPFANLGSVGPRERQMAQSQRPRYGHPFSAGKSGLAFRGQTTTRGKPPSARRR